MNMAKVAIRMKKAGSMSIEKNASRLAPIPSKLLPVSRAAIIEKNFPSPIRYAKKIKSPPNEISDRWFANGSSSEAHTRVDNAITGAIWKIMPVVPLNTLPFLRRTAISFSGWKIPGPLRPDAILFVRRMIPGKNSADMNIRITPGISDQFEAG